MTRARAPRRVAGRIRGARIRRKRLRLPRDRRDRRSALLLVIYLLGLVALGGRLVQVQIVQAEEYRERGLAQRNRVVDLSARRGRLYDRNGDVLATSVDSATIFADPRAYLPRELPDGEVVPPEMTAAEVAAVLAPELGVDEGELVAKLTQDAHFVYLARQLDWGRGERILALDLPGIQRLTEPKRVYPAGRLAAQVLGFTGIDGDGLEGLELAHDDQLAGTPGRLVIEQAPEGLTIGLQEVRPAVPGTDLVLTIDREIQAVAEEAATRTMEEFDAVGAGVVVLDAKTFEVLAAASVPGFEPSDRDGTDLLSRRNRVVTDVFEPGSVQKAVTVAAAIEEDVVTPGTVYEVPDHLQIGSKTFRDSHPHPTENLTVADILQSSSNVGTMKIAQALGPERLHQYLERFGYHQPPGTGFPGEAAGLVPAVEDWWVTSLPTIAIGQGVAATLMHSAAVYATLANDGEAIAPRIVRGTVDEHGELTPAAAGARRQVVSADTARAVREMLAGVVGGDRGTGHAAAVPGYTVAGKTGTARKPLVDGRGYSTEYIAAFVGMAPVDDPEVVVAVMVDEPTPIWGGTVAAPLFAEVMEFTLRARHVAPSEPMADVDSAFAAAAQAAEDAAAAAAQEGPATAPDDPGAPPMGAAAGGDGTPVGAAPDD